MHRKASSSGQGFIEEFITCPATVAAACIEIPRVLIPDAELQLNSHEPGGLGVVFDGLEEQPAGTVRA
jgi:hypothetical protein